MRNLLISLVIGSLLGVSAGWFMWKPKSALKFTTTYQAVLLDDNQVYFGKLSDTDSPFPVLTDVFYVKSGTDPLTKEVKNVLVKRGKELHGPDRMYLNPRHVVLIEPVGANSQIAKLIEQSKNE